MANASNRLSPADNLPGEGNRAPAALRQARYSFTRRVFRQAIGIVLAGMCIVPLALVIWALYDIRFPSTKSVAAKPVLVVRAADGQTLFGQGSFRLAPVDAKDMPPKLLDAVLSIEDRGFYQHGAIDVPSVLRAFTSNLRAGRIVAGGSTITQQLVKMRFLGPERTYRRKIEEAAISIWLQYHLTKDQILTNYLNSVYLGSGAIGFPAAAKLYFNKNLADLTVPEAAMLAGMIHAPSQDNAFSNLPAARNRATTVLDAMVANGKLSVEDALAAKLHPATPVHVQISAPSTGWFADWVDDQAAKVAPDVDGAIEVHTTLDTRLQNLATNVVKATLAEHGAEDRASQAALIAMRPDGAVVAMVGGRNYSESKFNRAVQAKRQPGSAFKLFDYYAALRQGLSPEDKILDEPLDIKGWSPENYGRHYRGRVTLADAFAHSLNAATVRLSQRVGIDQIIAAARDLGLHAPLHNVPSLALGTSEVSLLDLTSAYAAVRAGEAPVEPWGIANVRLPGATHEVPVGRPDESQHSLGQYQQALISLLQGVVQHGTGRAAALPGFAAGKTGTSQAYRDAWFVGFTNSLVVGVWVGNDDHSPMRGVVGGSLPAMIWKAFMEQVPPPTAPDVAQQQINPPTQTANPKTQTTAETKPKASKKLFDRSELAVNQNSSSASSPPAGTKCDISMCGQHYHSFRASDCSYQPYDGGPRRYCTRQSETANGTTSHRAEGHSSLPPRRAEAPSAPPRAEGPFVGPTPYGRSSDDEAPGPWFDMRRDGW